jgi:hypothetical protein
MITKKEQEQTIRFAKYCIKMMQYGKDSINESIRAEIDSLYETLCFYIDERKFINDGAEGL